MHLGEGARRELEDAPRRKRNIFGEMAEYFGKLEKIVDEDEEHNNQQETGTRLL